MLKLIIAVVAAVTGTLELPDGGSCRVVTSGAEENAQSREVIRLSAQGDTLWKAAAPEVRPDCSGEILYLTGSGNIQCVFEAGTGYTDIILIQFSPEGLQLASDTIAMTCYDSPLAICQSGENHLLAWDSWSEERGVHTALISPGGTVLETTFAVPTLHPMPVALESRHGLIILGISPAAAEEAVLCGLDQRGAVLWTSDQCPEVMTILDIALDSDGSCTVLWSSNVPAPLIEPVVSFHGSQGTHAGTLDLSGVSPSIVGGTLLSPYEVVLEIEEEGGGTRRESYRL